MATIITTLQLEMTTDEAEDLAELLRQEANNLVNADSKNAKNLDKAGRFYCLAGSIVEQIKEAN